jgi:hypothetical protein
MADKPEATLNPNDLFNAMGVFITALGAAVEPDFAEHLARRVDSRVQAMQASGEKHAAKLAAAFASALRIGAASGAQGSEQ